MTGEELKEKTNEKMDETRRKLDEIKESISNLKKSDFSKEIREEKLERIREKLQEANEEITEKADTLKDSVVSQFQTMIDSLKNEYNLLLSVGDQTPGDSSVSGMDTYSIEQEKGFFKKTKDWIGEQWNDVLDKEKRQEEGGKNVLRTAGFVATGVGAISLAYKGIKKLFSKESREARKEKRKERREARRAAREERKQEVDTLPFWQRPFGKLLKGTAIGTAVVGGIYGLGKLLGLVGKGDKVDGRSSDEDKLNGYEEEIVNNSENKEIFDNYETFGENIDILYGSIYYRELKAGYADELKMEKIAKDQSDGEKYYKGIVPYCLDNQFKSVENILGQNSSMRCAMEEGLDSMINYIKSKGNDFLQLFVDNYLSKLTSWTSLNLTGSLSNRIAKWKVENVKSQQEMQYFFRQSIRVQTYLFEKKDQLIQKIVKESSVRYGVSEKDIRGDDEKIRKYVLNTPEYQNFINSPISYAVTILKNYNILDSEITEEKKEEVKELDKQRDEILGCKEGEKDILQIVNEKKEKGEDLTEEENKALEKACDGIVKDVDDRILEAVEESARNIYGDLLGSDDSHLREYLDKSGLDRIFQEYKQKILQRKLELQEGKLDNEHKIALAESINAMLALKKEAVLGSQTIEKDYDENGNIIYRIGGFLKGSVINLCKSVGKLCDGEFLSGLEYLTSAGLGTGLIITATGVIFGLFTGKFGLAKVGAKITVLPVSLTCDLLGNIKPVRNAVDKINYPCKFLGEKGPQKLMNLLKDDKISLSKASEIVRRKTLSRILNKQTERRRKDFFGIKDKDTNDVICKKVFDKIVTEWSDTAAGATYLQSIKSDDELYETLVKNYDTSGEIKKAISENASIDKLKEAAGLSQVPEIQLSQVPEILRNNPHYQSIMKDLEDAEDSIKAGIDPSKLSNPELKWLKNIDNFRDSLKDMDPNEIERAAELLSEFKKGKTISHAIEQFETLSKLEGKVVEFEIFDETGNPIKKNLDEIIKNMDTGELRLCRGKISGVSNDAINSLIETFEAIKKSKVLNFSSNIDEIGKVIKMLVKALAKAT